MAQVRDKFITRLHRSAFAVFRPVAVGAYRCPIFGPAVLARLIPRAVREFLAAEIVEFI